MQQPSEKPFRLLTWNINGLANTLGNLNNAYKGLKGFFQHLDLHAVCLQEVKMPESKQTREVVLVDGFESFWAISQPPKTGYSGVNTYVQKAYSPVSAEVDSLGKAAADESGDDDTFDEQLDREGRCVITDLVEFVLINVYVPNAGDQPARPRLEFKCRFLEALKRKMDALKFAGREVILVGDLNVAAEKRDVHPSINYDQLYDERELQLLHSLLSTYPDVWRRFHPHTDGCYTVWEERTNARSRNAGLRLDYVLVTPNLLDRLVSCEILYTLPPKWSDHVPMILELSGVPPVPSHPPCAKSSEKDQRFHDRGQKKISSMFAAAAQGSQRKAAGGAGKGEQQSATATAQEPRQGAGGEVRCSEGASGAAGTSGSVGGQKEQGTEGVQSPCPQEQTQQQQQQQQQQKQEQPGEPTAGLQQAPAPQQGSQTKPGTSSQQEHQHQQQQQQKQEQHEEKEEDLPGPSSQEQPDDGHKPAGKRAASNSSLAASAKKAKVQGSGIGKGGAGAKKKGGVQQQASPAQQKQQRSMTSFLQGPKQT